MQHWEELIYIKGHSGQADKHEYFSDQLQWMINIQENQRSLICDCIVNPDLSFHIVCPEH